MLNPNRWQGVLLALWAVGCKQGVTQAASTTETSPSAAQPAVTATAGALPQLAAARALRGTGLEVALPAGAVRAGRPLVFEVPSAGIHFELSHQSSASPARVAAERAAKLFGMKREFVKEGEAWQLTETPERIAVAGTVNKDVLGNFTQDQQGLIATRNNAGHLAFVRASFPAAARAVSEDVARSVEVHPETPLDPLDVHGLVMPLANGYVLKPNQLHPVVVLPAGTTHSEGQPSVDMRVAAPGKVEELVAEMFSLFKADPAQTQCTDKALRPDRAATAGQQVHGQTCRFESGRGGDYRIRLDALEDAEGGVVAITTIPLSGAAQHEAAFDQMLAGLKLKPLPTL